MTPRTGPYVPRIHPWGTAAANAHPSSLKAAWIPAFAEMTEEGLRAYAVRTIIPAFAGMTIKRCSREGGNPLILPRVCHPSTFTDHGCANAPDATERPHR